MSLKEIVLTYPFRFVCLLIVDYLFGKPSFGIGNNQQKNDPKRGEEHRRRTQGYPRHQLQKLFFFLSCCRDKKKRSAGCAQREKKHEWQDFAKGEGPLY